MEHGREVYVEEKKTVKDRFVRAKDWIGTHKGEVVLITLSAASLATYATYYIFEGKNYKQ